MKKLTLILTISLLLFSGLFADEYARNKAIDIIHYKFQINLFDNSNEIKGITEITVSFKENGVDRFIVDLIGMKDTSYGMTVSSIDSENEDIKFQHENDKLVLFLNKSQSKNNTQTFRIHYSGIPEDGLVISENKFGDKTFFADNWPNRARHWIPTLDHPSDKATCEFLVTASEKYQVVSNGLQVEESSMDGGQKLTHWKENADITTYCMVIGVSRFAMQTVDIFKNIPIQTWVFPQNKEEGFYDFYRTRRVMEFFDNKIGPYAYEKIANVQSKTRYGGMENASVVFYNERSVSGERSYENTVVHELAHQWFGDCVTQEDWNHIWLSEGFATYFTHVFNEFTFGKDRMVRGLQRDRNRIIKFYEENPDLPLVEQDKKSMSGLLSTNSYQKGSWVLHMLRGEVGDETFFKGIRKYYNKFKNGVALTSDLQNVMEDVSGLDLSNFFEQWIFTPGHPEFTGDWKYDKRSNTITVNIKQVQDTGVTFKTPLEIGIYTEDNSSGNIERVDLDSKDGVFQFKLESKPVKVVLDPGTWLLMKCDFKEK